MGAYCCKIMSVRETGQNKKKEMFHAGPKMDYEKNKIAPLIKKKERKAFNTERHSLI